MRIKLFFLMLFSAFFIIGNAQILYQYPKGQDFYEGGREQFRQDLRNLVKINQLNPCEKTEVLMMRFVVYPDRSIKYVADEDKLSLENNKCMKDKTLEIIKSMNKWKPAEVNGKKTPAMFAEVFTDALFFENQFNEDDHKSLVYIHKNKESTISQFRKNFMRCFDTNGYTVVGKYSFVLHFDVNANGEAGFFYIDMPSSLNRFNEMVIECASNTKTSYWKPATFKNIPYKSRLKMPITFTER